MKKHNRKRNVKHKIILTSLISITVVLLIGLIIVARVPKSTVPMTTSDNTATLTNDANKLGVNPTKLNLLLVDKVFAGTGDVAAASGSDVISSFVPPNYIFVKSGLSSKDEVSAVAYEYMHFVWYNLTASDKQVLTAVFQQLYDNNAQFRQESSIFVGDDNTINGERHSIACVHMSPSTLPAALNNYCDQKIPNRETVLF